MGASDANSVALYCKHCTDLKWAWKANRLNPRPLGGATCQGWEMQRTEVSMQNLFARNLLWITRVKEFCDLTKKFQRDNAKIFHSDIRSQVFISQSKFWLHFFHETSCFFQFSVFRNLDFMVFFLSLLDIRTRVMVKIWDTFFNMGKSIDANLWICGTPNRIGRGFESWSILRRFSSFKWGRPRSWASRQCECYRIFQYRAKYVYRRR